MNLNGQDWVSSLLQGQGPDLRSGSRAAAGPHQPFPNYISISILCWTPAGYCGYQEEEAHKLGAEGRGSSQRGAWQLSLKLKNRGGLSFGRKAPGRSCMTLSPRAAQLPRPQARRAGVAIATEKKCKCSRIRGGCLLAALAMHNLNPPEAAVACTHPRPCACLLLCSQCRQQLKGASHHQERSQVGS